MRKNASSLEEELKLLLKSKRISWYRLSELIKTLNEYYFVSKKHIDVGVFPHLFLI